MAYLEIKNVSKTYHDGIHLYEALKNISLSFERGEFVAIVGESGCGKSTLLNLIATIHQPTKGEIILANQNLATISKKVLEQLRRNEIGILFQEYNLIENMRVLSNLKIVLNQENEREICQQKLKQVGLTERINSYVHQLSGGQKQRIALSRCLLNSPSLLLCDEPTGALDSENSLKMMQLIREQGKKSLVLCVSHDLQLIRQVATRIITLEDGRVISDEILGETSTIKNKQGDIKDNKLSFGKIISYCYRNISVRKGRFLISIVATMLALLFIYLGLGIRQGAMNYLEDLFVGSCDARVLDLANYYKIDDQSYEIPLDYKLLQTLKESKNYDIRPNINDFYNDFLVDNLYYSFSIHKRKIHNVEFKMSSNYFVQDQLIFGRLPKGNRYYEIIVNEAFIKELQYMESVEKDYEQYLNAQLDCKVDIPLYFLGENHEYLFDRNLVIVGIVKDTIFTKGLTIFMSHQLNYQYLNETMVDNVSLFDMLRIQKYQIDIHQDQDIIEVVNSLKKSRFYAEKIEIDDNYRYTFNYSAALNDYMTFHDLLQSLIIIIYSFGFLSLAITIILVTNTIYSVVNEILHDLAIMSIVGVKSSSILLFPLIFSCFINLITFGCATGIGRLSLLLNPSLNNIFKTKNILYLDLFSNYEILMTVFIITIGLILASIIFPYIRIKRMNLLEVLRQ